MRKRIVHFIHLDGDGGGPYTVVKHITFYSHQYDLHILHGGSGRIAKACDTLGIPHTRLETERMADAIASAPVIIGLLSGLRPDLIVLHGQWAGALGGICARLAGVRHVLYIAHWPAFYTDWDFLRVLRNWVTEWVSCLCATCIVAICPSNHQAYLQMYPWSAKKFRVLSNSIDLAEQTSKTEILALREEHGWESDKIHIVSVGRLSDQKKVDWLVQAWAQCAAVHDRAQLWIIGDGEERAALEQLTKNLQLEGTCRFLGNQPRGAVFIAASDIVVFTSVYESFGNVSLEAMLAGKPIIANDVAGIDSTVQDGVQGFLVPPGDITTLAARIQELVENPDLRRQLGENGTRRVTQFLTPVVLPKFMEVISEQLAAAYK